MTVHMRSELIFCDALEEKTINSNVLAAKIYFVGWKKKEMERIGSMCLDHVENQAAHQIPMKMAGWVQMLDAFLAFNEYDVLTNANQVSAAVANRLAEEQYIRCRGRQDREFESDFERGVKLLKGVEE